MASKNNFKLLTRDQFREGTFERDKHIVRMEALEEEELEWQKELNGDYDSN